jgi:hypothetical protein
VFAAASFGEASAQADSCTPLSVQTEIVQSGKYCLTTDLTLQESSAFEVSADNVTLDLNGFRVRYIGPVDANVAGILVSGQQDVILRNGVIEGFPFGVHVRPSATGRSAGVVAEDLRIEAASDAGIFVSGIGLVVRRNEVLTTGPSVLVNASVGIFAQDARNVVIADNIVSEVTDDEGAAWIYALSSAGVEIRENSVFDISDDVPEDNCDQAFTIGIGTDGSRDVAVIGNRILNPERKGQNAILAGRAAGAVICSENTVTGYKNGVVKCTVESGNLDVPRQGQVGPIAEDFCGGPDVLGAAPPGQVSGGGGAADY